MNHLRTILATAMLALTASTAHADGGNTSESTSTTTPVVHHLIFTDNSIGINMSDNGKWVVANVYSSEDQASATAHLCNIDTDTYDDLPPYGSVADVTDDGNLVVGSYNGRPAYWTRHDNKWHTIPLAAGWSVGTFRAVTPDGRYAVGSYMDETLYYERGVMWDLKTNREVRLTKQPTKNMLGTDSGEMRYCSISPTAATS